MTQTLFWEIIEKKCSEYRPVFTKLFHGQKVTLCVNAWDKSYIVNIEKDDGSKEMIYSGPHQEDAEKYLIDPKLADR